MKNKAKAALSILLLGLVSSCGAKTTETLGGESHFLSRCNEACAEGLSCIEGVCTVECDAEATCTPWSSSATCTAAAGFGTEVCDVACIGDVDCSSLTGTHSCSHGYCRAAFSGTNTEGDCEADGVWYEAGESFQCDCNTCICVEDGTFQSTAIACAGPGNAPVIDQAALRVVASEDGRSVVVSAEPAGVSPGGVEVTVTNSTTGESGKTTSAEDGSFEVTVPGSVEDVYEIAAGPGDDVAAVVVNGDGTPGPSGDPTALSGLVGNDYQLESSEGFTPVEGTTVRINIDESDFGFSAGCNGHGGSYTFCDGRLCMSDSGSTGIACDAPRQAQDEWLADFFTSTPSVVRMGDRVTFATEYASLAFLDIEVANPDRPLTGRVWSINTLISGGTASISPTQAMPTLEFGEDGSVTVFTSCVQGTGSWDSGIGPPPEGELTLGNIAYPEEPCDESGSTLAHDHIVSVITQGEVTFTIDETRLTVMRGDIGLGATTE